MKTREDFSYPISLRTGEPKVPLTLWLAILCNILGSIFIAVSTVYSLVMAVYDYGKAARITQLSLSYKPEWVQNLDKSYPPEWAGWKFIFVILLSALAVFLISILSISVYYTRWGRRWARRFVWISALLSGFTLLLTELALPAIPLAILAAIFTSFPSVSNFIKSWENLRHPKITPIPQPKEIIYGDFPRYLT